MVKGVDEVDVFGRNQLVLDEHRRGDRLLLQDAQRQLNQLIAVSLGEIPDRADQAGPRLAKLIASFDDGIPAHHGAEMGNSGLFEGS